MAVYLSNAFSLNMLDDQNPPGRVEIEACRPEAVPAEAESIIGHPNTAQLVSARLGRLVPVNRATLRLYAGDVLYVAQYRGERLKEGVTELPSDATLAFYRIVLI
jgi:hypothetical protein